MRESNGCSSNSVKEISKSISDLSKGLCASVELLSRTVASQPQIYQNLNLNSPTVSQQQGCYAEILGEASRSQSQNLEI